MLTVGDKLPDFTLKAVVSLDKGKEFKELSNKDFEGKWIVLFAWPMDFTFICPTEIAEFGRRYGDFKERDAEVLGMSTDTEFVHLAWRRPVGDSPGSRAADQLLERIARHTADNAGRSSLLH